MLEAASTTDDQGLYEAQRDVFLDPSDPDVVRAAEQAGIPRDWIEAAQRSPIHALINTFRVALPLHPEYRTMPMVWYIPPLSPVVDVVAETGEDAEDKGNLFAAIDALRIPVEYLAELFTAGDVEPVDAVLKKLAAMRCYMRDLNLGRDPDGSIPAAVGMSEEEMYDMYRLLAIAKYDERYVIPPAHAEQAHSLEELVHGVLGLRVRRRAAGPLRRGVRHPDADRGRELPDAPRPADLRLAGRAGGQGSAGEPAQLGRQGLPAGAVPAGRAGLMSSRRDRAGLRPEQLTIVWQSVSLLLDYPDETVLAHAALVRSACERLPAGRRQTRSATSSSTWGRRRCRSSRPTTSRPSTTGVAATCS